MAKPKKGEIDRWTTDGAGIVVLNPKNQNKKKETVKKTTSVKKRGK